MAIETLIQGCKRNDRMAQKQLYNRYVGMLYRLSLRYVKVVNDAEDCTSEAFVKVFEKLPTFEYKEINSFEVWIKQIVINQSLMCLRKRNDYQMIDVEEAFEIGEDFPIEQEIDAQTVLKIICRLPDGYRTVFNLYAIEGYTHVEISKMLNISENTSKSQLHKARKMLMERLKAIYNE